MTIKCVMCKAVNPNPLIKVCGYQCANAWLNTDKGKAKKEAAKARLARRRLRSQKEQLLGIKHQEKLTQSVVNKLVLLRDKDQPCISCGIKNHEISSKGLTGSEWHSGHFRSVGSCSELRFHLWNINKQCATCNLHLSSNRSGYEAGIVARYGEARLEWLTSYHKPVKRSIEYLKKFRKVINKKIRRMSK